MQFKVYAVRANGTVVFDKTLSYIPRKGEEMQIDGCVFVVENVRYVISTHGLGDGYVKLQLAPIN